MLVRTGEWGEPGDVRLLRAVENALQVQDAVSVAGIVADWHNVSQALWEVASQRGEGTEWVNTHPVSRLFAFKVVDLVQPGITIEEGQFGEVYRWAMDFRRRSLQMVGEDGA